MLGRHPGPLDLSKKVPAGLRVETFILASEDQATVAQAHGAEVAHTLASKVVTSSGIVDVRR
jgi:hypothetical protein